MITYSAITEAAVYSTMTTTECAQHTITAAAAGGPLLLLYFQLIQVSENGRKPAVSCCTITNPACSRKRVKQLKKRKKSCFLDLKNVRVVSQAM